MNSWPAPGWLDCDGLEVGDGTVRCQIPVRGNARQEVVVPAQAFDAGRRRLRVRVVRPADLGDQNFDCPSQEMEALAYVVECPTIDGAKRFDVLSGFLNERLEETEQAVRSA